MRTVQSLALLAGCCVVSRTASAFIQPAAPGATTRCICLAVWRGAALIQIDSSGGLGPVPQTSQRLSHNRTNQRGAWGALERRHRL